MTTPLKIQIIVDDKGSVKIRQVGTEAEKAGRKGEKAFRRTGRSIDEMNQQSALAASRILKVVGSIAALTATIYGVKKLVEGFMDTAKAFEAMEIKLNALTQGRGVETLERINAWALNMPVNTRKAVDTFVMMQAMGLQPTIDKMQTLVDVSAIFGEEAMPRVARALGQIQTLGKLSAEELNQMAEVGINARKYLTEAFGQTVEELQKSGIAIEKVVKAIMDGMEAEFGGAAAAAMKTWSGMTTTLVSYWEEFKRQVMDSGPFDALKEYLGEVVDQLEEMKKSGELDEWATNMAKAIVGSMQTAVQAVMALYNVYQSISKVVLALYERYLQAMKIYYQYMALTSWGGVKKGYLKELTDVQQTLADLGMEFVKIDEATDEVNKVFEALTKRLEEFKTKGADPATDAVADIAKGLRDEVTPAAKQATQAVKEMTVELGYASGASAYMGDAFNDYAEYFPEKWEDANEKVKAVTKDTTKYVETLWDKALNRVELSLADTFYDEFKITLDDSLGLLEDFLNSMIRMVSEKAAAMTMYSLFGVNTGTGQPQGWGGLISAITGSGGGGGIGITDLLGAGNSAYSLVTGDSLIGQLASSVASYLGIGTGATVGSLGIGAGSSAIYGSMYAGITQAEISAMIGAELGAGGVASGTGGMSSAAMGGIYAAAMVAAIMIITAVIEHNMGPDYSRLATESKILKSKDPNRIFQGEMYKAFVTGGQWDEAHAQEAAERIAGLLADTMDMYNVLFENMSEASQDAVSSAIGDIEKLTFYINQEASEGAPIRGYLTRQTPDEITGHEWQRIENAMKNKWTDATTMLGGLSVTMRDAIITAIEEGGDLTGKALADIMGISYEELKNAFQSEYVDGLQAFIDQINEAYKAGEEMIGKHGTIPEAFQSVFGEYFVDYIEEGLENIKAGEMFGKMTQEIQDAFNSLDLDMFLNDINKFTEIFTDAGFKIQKAARIWESLESFVGRSTDEITAYEKAAAKAQIEVAAYVDMMAQFGTELSEEEIAAKTKAVMAALTGGIDDLQAAVEPLGVMGQLVAAYEGQFAAYKQALKDTGAAIEEITELEILHGEGLERLLDEYKGALGLFGEDYLQDLKLDEIAERYKQFGLTFQEMIDWFTDASLSDIQAVADELGVDWTVIADEIGFLVKAITDLGDAAGDATQSILDAQWELAGITNEMKLAGLEEKYGLTPGSLTSEYAQQIIADFIAMSTGQVEAFAEAKGVSVDELISDITFLANAFDDVGDSVEDVTQEITDYARQIRDVLGSGGPGGSGASASAAALWAQVVGMQGGRHTGDSLLLMSETLVKWYDAAVQEAEEEARLHEQVADRLASLISQIDDTIRNIKYSDLNVGLPHEVAAEAQQDWDTLLAAARTGGIAEVQELLSFAPTYLQQQQNDLKSSQDYQDVYATVMANLAEIKGRAEAGGYDAAILAELQSGQIHADLSAINAQFAEMENWILSALRDIDLGHILLEIDWGDYSGTAAEALQSLLALVEEYGWENTVTLDFIADMAAWAAQDIENAIWLMDQIADKSGGWDSLATITFIAAAAAEIASVTDAEKMLEYIYRNSGGWLSEATLTFLASLDPSLIGMNSAELMLKHLLGGNWDPDMYLQLKAALVDGEGTMLENIDAWLKSVGIDNMAISRTLELNLLYNMSASGEINANALADWAYAKIIDAVAIHQENLAQAQALLESVELLSGMLGGTSQAGVLGTWIAHMSAEAQAAGLTPQEAPGIAMDVWQSIMGYTRWAEGGIVTQPTLGVLGEAGYPEIVIPMKDGYSVPVKWVNGGSTQQGATERPLYITVEVAGKEFYADVQQISRVEADYVRVKANRRPGNKTERLYQ